MSDSTYDVPHVFADGCAFDDTDERILRNGWYYGPRGVTGSFCCGQSGDPNHKSMECGMRVRSPSAAWMIGAARGYDAGVKEAVTAERARVVGLLRDAAAEYEAKIATLQGADEFGWYGARDALVEMAERVEGDVRAPPGATKPGVGS